MLLTAAEGDEPNLPSLTTRMVFVRVPTRTTALGVLTRPTGLGVPTRTTGLGVPPRPTGLVVELEERSCWETGHPQNRCYENN